MAKVIQELPRKHGGAGRSEQYPYAEWLDGQIWQLVEGEDYKSKSTSMLTNIRQAAQKRDLKVRTRFVDGGIVVQAYKPEADEPEQAKPRPTSRKK